MWPECWHKSGLWDNFLFCFNILILIYSFKYETISTFAPTFWTHIISELGGVYFVLHIGSNFWISLMYSVVRAFLYRIHA